MSELADVLEALAARGLLDRAAYVKAGDVEVQLGPPVLAEPGLKPVSREEEMRLVHETQYAAARGVIPGAS